MAKTVNKAISLGRGKGTEATEALYPPAAGDRSRTGVHRVVNRNKVELNPFQPRKKYPQADLNKLGQSIYQHGLIEPLIGREHPTKKGWVQVIDGEGRFRSTEPRTGFNGVIDLDFMIREATDEEMGDVAFVANIQRRQHTPSEEVAKVKRMVERGLNASQIATLTGETNDWTQKRVALATKLQPDVLWILDYHESITFAEESNKLVGALRKTTLKFIESRANEATYKIDLSVREFRRFVEDRGGFPKALRSAPAPQQANNGALSLPVPGKASKQYKWEEDVPAQARAPKKRELPEVHPSALPHTAARIKADAALLEGYTQKYADSDYWDDDSRGEMMDDIDQAMASLEAAREILSR